MPSASDRHLHRLRRARAIADLARHDECPLRVGRGQRSGNKAKVAVAIIFVVHRLDERKSPARVRKRERAGNVAACIRLAHLEAHPPCGLRSLVDDASPASLRPQPHQQSPGFGHRAGTIGLIQAPAFSAAASANLSALAGSSPANRSATFSRTYWLDLARVP